MKKKFKIVVLVSLIISLLTSCTQTNIKEEKKIDKDHIFTENILTDLMNKMEITDINQLFVRNNRLYVKGSYLSSDGSVYEYDKLASINLDGSEAYSFVLKTENTEDNQDSTQDESNDIANTPNLAQEDKSDISLYEVETTKEELEIGETETPNEAEEVSVYEYDSFGTMGVKENGNYLVLKIHTIATLDNDYYKYEYKYQILELDNKGNTIEEKNLEIESSDDEIVSTTFIFDEKGKSYYIEKDTKLVILNENGQKISEVELKGVSFINNIYLKNNKIYVAAWDDGYNNYNIYSLDDDGKTFSNGINVPANSSIFLGDDTYDFFISTDKELKGWNIEKEEPVVICNYVDSDIPVVYVDKVVSVNNDQYYLVYSSADELNSKFVSINKVNPNDIKDKKVITLAGRYIGNQIKKKVIDYNKNNDEYRIKLVDYSEYDIDGDTMGGISRLNMDIASGNEPDIYILDESMPIDSYINKGLFEDIKPLMNNSGIKEEDYLINSLRLYSRGDKYYCVVPSFYIQTYAAKDSLTKNISDWNIKEARKLLEKMPEGTMLFSNKTKNEMLSEGLLYTGNSFVDWEKGICKFNTQKFIDLLEFANTYPLEIDYSSIDYTGLVDNAYRENKVLLINLYTSSIGDLNYIEKGTMGEKMRFIGFPSENEKGAIITPNGAMAVSSKSTEKEEAWKFISYYLTDDYQSSDEIYGFPVMKKYFDKQIEKAQKKPFYIDDKGNKVEYDEYYYTGDKEILITPMTEERAKEIYDYIISVDQKGFTNSEIIKIIEEEAQGYFQGQKTAKEVADIIQSRTEIFVKENK